MLIPRNLIFGNPERVAPRLAPDGKAIAFLAPRDGVLNVWVRDLETNEETPLTADRGRGIQEHGWSEDSKYLIYSQDLDGDENWRLFMVGRAGGAVFDLTPLSGVQARIIGTSPLHPGRILVGLNDRDPRLHDVHEIDLATRKRKLVLKNEVGAVGWTADHDLVVRIATIPEPDGGMVFRHREGDGAAWRELLRVPPEDAWTTSILDFAADNRVVYLRSSIGRNSAQLFELDTVDGAMRWRAGDESADVASILTHPTTHAVEAVGIVKARLEWRILEEGIRGDIEALTAARPGDLGMVMRSLDDSTWLSAHTLDRGSVVYHIWDRRRRRALKLFSARPGLDDLALSEMKPISFTARDGLRIHGYLTLPPVVEPVALPAVINVHGGPWHRDTWGWHGEAQWLANRGYACLQVNFRGSTGYGKAFLNAGDREWGGKMQDDISDAAAWLIKEGIADPARLGIFGGSYGGYSVLSALTSTPDLFACGVDLVGPSNLISFIKSIPPYWEPMARVFKRRVGDIETEEDFLRSRSPLFHVENIRVPLLIVQGKNDPRVKREESLQIRDALLAAGKQVEFHEFPDEGHGFVRPENRLTFYAMAEAFLAKHLGGRAEP